MDFESCLWFAFFEKESKISGQTLDMTSYEDENVSKIRFFPKIVVNLQSLTQYD
jgi:hypothetical protein